MSRCTESHPEHGWQCWHLADHQMPHIASDPATVSDPPPVDYPWDDDEGFQLRATYDATKPEPDYDGGNDG